jgi:hypothetical protein
LTGGKYIDSNSFKFNTVVVFYNIYDGEEEIYSNIPLGMFVTGVIDEGVMSNPVTKFVSNDDIYGAGTSYGLRICNRFTVAPNGVTIKSESDVISGEDNVYPALSQAMSAMVDSQTKMDQLINNFNDYQNNIKDHLSQFKNYRTNVPYILYINETPYWFINGKNTGCKAYDPIITGNNIDITDNVISAKGYIFDDTYKSFAEGENQASGRYSHAEGYHTITNNLGEHAGGCYNISNLNTLYSIGIGSGENDRKNAFEVTNNGDVYIKNIGGYNGESLSEVKSLQTIILELQSTIIDLTNRITEIESSPTNNE